MSAQHRGYLDIEIGGPSYLYQIAHLQGWRTLGTVTTAEGTGALVQNKTTRIYCQANAGVLRSLPQKKVAAALAAKKASSCT